jgi:hypothetical protein
MAGNPNPSFSITVSDTGLAGAPTGNGNVPLIIGNTSQGAYSGSPGVGLYSVSNLTTLLNTLGSYGNAVDAAALCLALGASDVLIYKAFSGTIGSSTHTGSGTGTIAQTGSPVAPYGTGQTGTGILVKIITGSTTATTYGTFEYSLDGGNTYSAPISNPGNAGTYLIPGTGVTLTFTGAETTGVWVAADTYVNPITAFAGTMYPYGGSFSVLQTTATGGTTVVGEGSFANDSGAPLDNFQVIIQIVATGTLAAKTMQYVYSFDGGVTYSNTQSLTSATVTLPGGVVLTAADTGGVGGSQAGFVAGELYSFSTLGPQLGVQDIVNITANLVGNPSTWGWIHIPQQANTVNTGASTGFELSTLFTDVATSAANFFNAGQYVGSYVLIDSPPDDPLRRGGVNIDSTLETWAQTAASDYVTVGTGNAAATVSPANGWQLPRGSSWDVSARMCVAPIGQDLAWVGAGPLQGVGLLYRNETNTPGLGPAGFAPLGTVPGATGYYIINGNILCSSSSDISLAQYRRVLNAACQATRSALVNFLSAGVRLTATGKIDPRDLAIIQNTCLSSVLSAINGQASGATVVVSNTLGAGGLLNVTVSITPFGYVKSISVTIGFVNPALAAQGA